MKSTNDLRSELYAKRQTERLESLEAQLNDLLGGADWEIEESSEPFYDSFYMIMDDDYMGKFTESPDWNSGKLIIDRARTGQHCPRKHRREFSFWQSSETIEELASYLRKQGYSKANAWLEAEKSLRNAHEVASRAADGAYHYWDFEITLVIESDKGSVDFETDYIASLVESDYYESDYFKCEIIGAKIDLIEQAIEFLKQSEIDKAKSMKKYQVIAFNIGLEDKPLGSLFDNEEDAMILLKSLEKLNAGYFYETRVVIVE